MAPVLGLRQNLGAFTLFVVNNAFVGAMVGLERAVVPVLGEQEFGVASKVAILGFVASFGLAKALANLAVGSLADRYGRKKLLVTGWLFALPVPLLILLAPNWSLIILANLVLGVNQGMTWSMNIASKIDLVGPKNRGLAMGLNEFSGYVAVGIAAFAGWELAGTHGSRPTLFWAGLAIAAGGILLSLLTRETLAHARHEAAAHSGRASSVPSASFYTTFVTTSWRDRTLFACSQAGLVNNLNDGIAWGLFPLLLLSRQADAVTIGAVAALYPASWGLLQIVTGPLSDRTGRKGPIASGMAIQAGGIWLLLGPEEPYWYGGALLLGLGTALVYPTLISAVSDVVDPRVRASAVGVYRFWRDLGFVVGAISVGAIADAFGLDAGIHVTAAVTLASGFIVALVMRETHPAAFTSVSTPSR